ncbi:MAG: aspartate--tRNA ligase [Chitinispirillales bacterium]|jgi:aspartyl-tRNA synthetase|nr:aspartate--tRNA ligase [Chitinispirillales bacterium]
MSNIDGWRRTHGCGELCAADIGKEVVICGWVHNWRDHGGVIFIDLRDRSGISQLVFNPAADAKMGEEAAGLRHEYVAAVKGTVAPRPQNMINPKMKTGEIEIHASNLKLINASETPPFQINDPDAALSEELRLRYRYLDLRRPALQQNIIFRHNVTMQVRKYMWENGFVEIETPVLMKSTPEGARDFLVPSRVNKGKFYALPQSPQTYKQILMVSGFERYFQIARCFRDEDLRADRQPEFTQIDAELSFVDEEDIYGIFEGMMKYVFKNCLDIDIPTPFQRMTYKEALFTYGSDKPDLRFGLPIQDVTENFAESQFKVFRSVIDSGGKIAAVNADSCGDFTRKTIDGLTSLVGRYGAKGLVWFRVTDAGLDGPSVKFLSDVEMSNIRRQVSAKTGDMIFVIADKEKTCFTAMGQLRLEIARLKNLISGKEFNFLWVTEFPLFELSEEQNRYTSVHHPFTAPMKEDLELLAGGQYYKARSRAYDLVINGTEAGGGSIRIHDSNVQRRIFDLLGISREEAREKFGFLLKALSFGAPPHAGLAFGLDRLVMLMLGLDSIRDVIPFPKTTTGLSLMDNAPDFVSAEQLAELGIKINE